MTGRKRPDMTFAFFRTKIKENSVLKIIKSLFLIVALALSVPALAEVEEQPPESVWIEVRDPLYINVYDVFEAEHNKLALAIFGKQNFISLIGTSVSPTVLSDLRDLSHEELVTLASPYPLSIAKVLLSVLLAFYVVALSYILIVNFKYYFERVYVMAGSGQIESDNAGGGQEYLLRVLLSSVLIAPMIPFLITALDDDVENDKDSPLFMTTLFTALGQAFEYTERVSRVFAEDDRAYTPFYYVPKADSVQPEFVGMQQYATCVASEKVVGEKRVLAKLNVSNGGKVIYESSYGECDLRISTSLSEGLFANIRRLEALGDPIGMNAAAMRGYEEGILRDELNSSLRHALKVAHRLEAEYYRKSTEKKPLDNDIPATIADGWEGKCGDYKLKAEAGNYADAMSVYPLLPYCYSRSFVSKFAYPNLNTGIDFDESDFNTGDGGRIYSACADIGEGQLVFSGDEKLLNCAQSVCNTDHLGKKGLYQCSLVVERMVEEANRKNNALSGFLMAPAHMFIEEAQVNASVGDRDLLNKFKLLTTGEFGWAGDIVFNEDMPRVPEKEIPPFSTVASSITLDDTRGAPYFAEFAITSVLERYWYCSVNEGVISVEYGVCGTSYQESNRFLADGIDLLVMIYIAKHALKSSKGLVGKNKNGGLKTALPSVMKNNMKTILASVGVGGATIGMVFGDEVMQYFDSFEEEHFSPFVSIMKDPVVSVSLGAILGNINATESITASISKYSILVFLGLVMLFQYLPLFVFGLAVLLAFVNLVTFIVTLPFQISNVFSDAGETAIRGMRQLIIKWLMVLFRFPIVVAGFYLSFFIFDALSSAVAESTSIISPYELVSFSDEPVAVLLIHLFSLTFFLVVMLAIMVACFGSSNTAYKLIKGYAMEDNSSDEGGELSNLKGELTSVLKS